MILGGGSVGVREGEEGAARLRSVYFPTRIGYMISTYYSFLARNLSKRTFIRGPEAGATMVVADGLLGCADVDDVRKRGCAAQVHPLVLEVFRPDAKKEPQRCQELRVPLKRPPY